MPDLYDIAWAAGFLDGEGCIALTRRSGAGEGTRCPVVHACQTSPVPLEKLAELFGGTVRYYRDTSKGTPVYQWSITGSGDIIDALDQLIPFLVLKKDRAISVRAYCRTVKPRGSRHTAAEVKRRLRLVDRYEEVSA